MITSMEENPYDVDTRRSVFGMLVLIITNNQMHTRSGRNTN